MKVKDSSPPDKAALSKVHRERSHITKSSTRSLHTLHALTADALDNLKANAKMRGTTVSIDLDDLAVGLNEQYEMMKDVEAKNELMKKIMWEGRYCDYIASALGRVKSSDAWKDTAPKKIKSEQWNKIKEALDAEADSGVLHAAFRRAAAELKFPYPAIRSWIDVYVARCESQAHHGNVETKLKAGNLKGGRQQIWADKEEIWDLTPREYNHHANHVMRAILEFEEYIFVSNPKYGDSYVLTKHGKKITGNS